MKVSVKTANIVQVLAVVVTALASLWAITKGLDFAKEDNLAGVIFCCFIVYYVGVPSLRLTK